MKTIPIHFVSLVMYVGLKISKTEFQVIIAAYVCTLEIKSDWKKKSFAVRCVYELEEPAKLLH